MAAVRARAEVFEDGARDLERVIVVVGQVIAHARQSRMYVAAAEILGGHFLAGRGAHQRRTGQEDGSFFADNYIFVAHRGHVRATRGATAHHDRDLRDAFRRHLSLVVEDAAEVPLVGKNLGLHRQKRAAGIDQVNARQHVFDGDLLRAKMLLHGHRKIRAAFDGRVVSDDHRLAAVDSADAGDDARGRRVAVVHVECGQRRQFEERTAGVEQFFDPVAREQLAAFNMTFARGRRTALANPLDVVAQALDQRVHRVAVAAELVGVGVQPRFNSIHLVILDA